MMRPLNLRVILLLGGILLITLGFQIFQRHSIENFITAATPGAIITPPPPAATIPPTPPVATAPTPTLQPTSSPPITSTTTPSDLTTGGIPVFTGIPDTEPEHITGTGVSYYKIPLGNDQFIKLSVPAQYSKVNIPLGPSALFSSTDKMK